MKMKREVFRAEMMVGSVFSLSSAGTFWGEGIVGKTFSKNRMEMIVNSSFQSECEAKNPQKSGKFDHIFDSLPVDFAIPPTQRHTCESEADGGSSFGLGNVHTIVTLFCSLSNITKNMFWWIFLPPFVLNLTILLRWCAVCEWKIYSRLLDATLIYLLYLHAYVWAPFGVFSFHYNKLDVEWSHEHIFYCQV